MKKIQVAIIGAGPAGLMAAEVLSNAGKTPGSASNAPGNAGNASIEVHVYDAMPSAGRKFLLAGIGGLNLTHSEPLEPFLSRFYERKDVLAQQIIAQPAIELGAWAKDLGIDTFVGTSGRVFPTDMKAAPLLRAWLQRLRSNGVQFHMRHRWTGWDDQGALKFEKTSAGGASSANAAELAAQNASAESESLTTSVRSVQHITVKAEATVLALGGASWQRLGSDGAWVPWLRAKGIDVADLQPANCGFDVQCRVAANKANKASSPEDSADASPTTGWSTHFQNKYAGQPFKTVAIRIEGTATQPEFHRQGEFVATQTGVEGSLIYAASKILRERIATHGSATFHLDLLPQWDAAKVLREVSHPRGSRSLSSHLSSRLNLEGIKLNILYELLSKDAMNDPKQLATAIKSLPITVSATRPIDEAISTAGGVRFEAMTAQYMLNKLPGVFCAGEMLDWEAPTGGYLLTAAMATGRAAGAGALAVCFEDR
jgi:predicted flavoprotein YhiN